MRTLFQAGNFLYWLSLYFYVPILPVYAQGMGAPLSLVGVMLSAYGVMQLSLRIPTGIASDALGARKPFVVAGVALTALGALAFIWAPSPWFLVLARAITGLAACGWVAITVMYAAYYAPEHAARAIAGMGLTNGLGQVIATYTGGVAADAWGWHAPFVLSVATGIGGVVMMLLCREVRAPVRTGGALTLRRMWEVGTSRTLLLVSTLSSLNTYATFTTVFGFIPVFARDLGASRAELGLLTAVSLIPFTIAQPIAARLSERVGFRTTVFAGLLLSGVMTLLTPLSPSFVVLVALQVVAGLGRGLLSVSLMSLAILSVDQSERATAMGVYQAVYSIGMFLGPLVGGFIGQQAGLGAVFVTTGLLSCGAALMAQLTLQPRYAAARATPGRGS
ncbi:MAG TPA: MFS transporter [Chloroflexota bacterium]|nr:MFS transporter [Chloroflexota bacterium]